MRLMLLVLVRHVQKFRRRRIEGVQASSTLLHASRIRRVHPHLDLVQQARSIRLVDGPNPDAVRNLLSDGPQDVIDPQILEALLVEVLSAPPLAAFDVHRVLPLGEHPLSKKLNAMTEQLLIINVPSWIRWMEGK